MRLLPPFAAFLLSACSAYAGTMEDIHGRGVLTCAVLADSQGFSSKSEGGRAGLAADVCSVLAASVLGRADATAYVEVTAEDSALALQAGDADVLLVPQPWSMGQEVDGGVMLVQPLLAHGADGVIFGPVVRQGDDSWFIAVRWVLLALSSVEADPNDPAVTANGLGLHPSWQTNIRSVSKDYAALLERHMKTLAGLGWAVVPPGPGPAW